MIWNTQKSSKIIDDKTAIELATKRKQTESIFCTSTKPSNCYLYRCNTGYIYNISLPMPGGNPLSCTDGSEIERVKEVLNPNL